MMAGPYHPLHAAERIAAVLGDVVDGLESFQATHPHRGLEQIIDQIKLARREVLRHIPREIDHGQAVE